MKDLSSALLIYVFYAGKRIIYKDVYLPYIWLQVGLRFCKQVYKFHPRRRKFRLIDEKELGISISTVLRRSAKRAVIFLNLEKFSSSSSVQWLAELHSQ